MTAGSRLTLVVAPDSFKGSLPAHEAARAIGAGLRDAAAARPGLELEVRARPVADGGEGTVDAFLSAGWLPHEVDVTGPTGRPVRACLALSPGGTEPRTAVVELATASGLTLLPDGRPAPRDATTRGTGELVAAALDLGVGRLVLAVGGSATTDGGAGMASALGVRFLDGEDRPLPPGGAALSGLAEIDVTDLDPRLLDTEVVVACDVDNPLTGPRGAAHVYGPQKGATPEDVGVLDAGLARLAQLLRRDLGIDVDRVPGAGRPAASPRGRSRSWAPGSSPASTSCWTSSTSTAHWWVPTSWSRARAPSTRRAWPGRRRWGSPAGPGRPASPSSCSPARSPSTSTSARASTSWASSRCTRCSTSSPTR